VISIVIRTRNEEAWIGRCLAAIALQDRDDWEVVLVDNASTDRTRRIARRFGCRVVTIPDGDFQYSRAINLGIARARGDLVAILSGHCIPAHDRWLGTLAAPFDDQRVAGVYGRQIPLPDSHAFDKRDLWTTFGVERRLQRSDYFFHNANSMIRRRTWEEIPFDETLRGVEDREWARRVLAAGHLVAYEPLAAVHHHHGIHQGLDPERAERVVRVIQMIGGRASRHGHHAPAGRSSRQRPGPAPTRPHSR
jgi:glycosyltransferase involved in cell wall biosynthesis